MDIGFPFWIYPVFIVVTSLSRLVNEDIFTISTSRNVYFLLQLGRTE